MTVRVLAEIAWNPEIRNILGLLVGVVVLVGSIVLIVGTNTGPRTGVLVVLACLFGWMTIMGAIWWMYGIGMKGTAPHWRVIEVNSGNLAAAENEHARELPNIDEEAIVAQILAAHPELAQKTNPDNKPGKITAISELVEADPAVKEQFHLEATDLGGWRILNPSDKQRGDAVAVSDAALVSAKIFSTSGDYHVIDAYDIGGKRQLSTSTGDCKFYRPGTYSDCISRLWDDLYSGIVQFSSPEHFAIVQVQKVVPQETQPGQAPPPPVVDESAPVISVVMIRGLGDVRFPGFMVFLISGVLFAVICNTLHRRDKLQAAHIAAAAAAG